MEHAAILKIEYAGNFFRHPVASLDLVDVERVVDVIARTCGCDHSVSRTVVCERVRTATGQRQRLTPETWNSALMDARSGSSSLPVVRLAIEVGPVDAEEDLCAICLSTIAEGEPVWTCETCGCMLHASTCCASQWLQLHHSCPMCRAVDTSQDAQIAQAILMDDACGAGQEERPPHTVPGQVDLAALRSEMGAAFRARRAQRHAQENPYHREQFHQPNRRQQPCQLTSSESQVRQFDAAPASIGTASNVRRGVRHTGFFEVRGETLTFVGARFTGPVAFHSSRVTLEDCTLCGPLCVEGSVVHFRGLSMITGMVSICSSQFRFDGQAITGLVQCDARSSFTCSGRHTGLCLRN